MNLAVNGRAEIVMLDTESYENLMERVQHIEAVAAVRAIVRETNDAGSHEEVTEAEMERRQSVMKELVEETVRLGLYR